MDTPMSSAKLPREPGSSEPSTPSLPASKTPSNDPPVGSLKWYDMVEARADKLGDLMLDLYEQEKAKT